MVPRPAPRRFAPLFVCLASLLAQASILGATAPTPTQIANLNPQIFASAELVTTARLESRSVFLLATSFAGGSLGDQIWATDGTTNGTIRLLDPELCDTDCFDAFQIVAISSETAFFVAVESVSRTPQLLVTDGTVAGTRQLTQLPEGGNLLLGSRALLHYYWSDRLERLFFMASDGLTGWELWSTSGTPATTSLIQDIHAGPADSIPYFDRGAETDRGVIFTAVDEDGDEPWRTDGTPAGTLQLRDVTPSASFAPPTLLTEAGNRVVFIADDGVHGVELWSTDGTPQGTSLLLDANPGLEPTVFGARRSATGQAFFVLADPDAPQERRLLRTDGTPAGTRMLGTFTGVVGGLPILDLVGILDARVVFLASGQLWTSDGTLAGTRVLDCVACPVEPHLFRPLGDRLVFRASDAARGLELWQTDGTPDGTFPLADVCPGPCSSEPQLLGRSGQTVYALADDGIHGVEVWSLHDVSGPTRLTDFPGRRPFPFGSFDGGLAGASPEGLSFLATDPEHGFALWTTNGTSGGTRPIRTLEEVGDLGSDPHAFTLLGGGLLFAAHVEDQGLGLWRLSLPGHVLELLAILDPSFLGSTEPRIRAVTTLGSRMFFADERQLDGDVWVTDGTPAGTRKLASGMAFGRDGLGKTLPSLGALVFFHTPGERPALWRTDGTPQGTRRVREAFLAPEEGAVTFAGRLWFRALLETECLCEMELWTSDGTAAGTRPFADVGIATSADPRWLTPFRGELYFETSLGLYKTNGVAPPVEALPGFPLPRIDAMVVLGNRLLLSVDSGGSEAGLWATDGTAAGTVQIAPVSLRQAFHLRRPQHGLVSGVLFFVESQGQIWRTDGTPGGTFPVQLLPSSVREIEGIHTLPSRLLLVTRDDSSAVGAWLTTGTPRGTEALPVLQAVGRSFATFASRVYLGGDDGRTGLEPWTFPLPDSGSPPPPPPTGLPAAPDRLQAAGLPFGRVQLAWRDQSNHEAAFVVQAKGSRLFSEYETVATLPANTTSFVVDNLENGRPYHFRVRAENGDGVSDWTAPVAATPLEVTGDCTLEVDLGRVLCLRDGRFEVRVRWRHEVEPAASEGDGLPTRFDFSDDSGTFWFFDPANVELVVKVLDARTVNGFQWVFYGALSNVEYWITVTDTQTQTNVTYYNPPGEICGLGDVRAFPRPQPPASGLVAGAASGAPSLREVVQTIGLGAAGSTCTPDAESLCLSQERYRVEVDWRDPRSGNSGRGLAIAGTADSGYFWFFDPANVELVVKVLDARTVNGHVWVFFGALTDVEYTVTVTDTATGGVKTYRNEPGNLCGQADVRAF